MERPPALKGKKKVQGHYANPVGAKLKRESLWNSHVRATILITREKPGTTAVLPEPDCELLDAESFPETPPPSDTRSAARGDDDDEALF